MAQTSISILYNLLKNSISDNQQIEVLVDRLSEILNASNDEINKNEFYSLIADAIVQCDIETSISSKEQRDALMDTVKALMKAEILPAHIALERFETETNFLLGIMTDKKTYNRLRTKIYFKQRKYNLLREENEGFAKILVELSRLNASNSDEVLSTITSIIGAYRVDPNRVVDLILSSFEQNLKLDSAEVYINFIRAFYESPTKLIQLIQLRLSFYSSTKNGFKKVPQSFYRMLAIMIHKEMLELEDIYASLMPSDSKILDHHKKLVEEARGIARKYATAVVGEEKPTKLVIDALREENPNDYHFLEVDNQKINLCAHLIDISDWDQALNLARKLPEYYCFSHPRFAESMCCYINYLIDPIYRNYAQPKFLNSRNKPCLPPKNGFYPPQIQEIANVHELFPLLLAFGPFISADTILLTKLIRLLRHIVTHQQSEGSFEDQPTYYQILDVLSYSILPATSLTCANCCLARELWTLLKNFKYHIRYKLYYEWRDESSNPIMLRNRGQILLRAKHHMKRLSKETLRPTGRNLGKLCYSNPVITLNYILIQIQSYDNLIGLAVDALRFLPPIAMDVLIYCIIESLSDPNKNKKSFDGMAIASWLTSLSNFSATIILRYKVEFTSFLEYIGNQLKAGNSLDLILLTDLVQKMTGIETIQAITDDRIEAFMGGDVLRTEGAYFNQVKNTRKPSARLKDALIESRLAMPLCTLMAQLRDTIFFNQQDGTPLKLVGKLYDQCQDTLVQYGAFLSMNLSIDDYINFLPPLEKLLTEYRLDPDSVFFLARPMIFHKIRSKFNELKIQATTEIPVEEGETPELSAQTLGIKFVEAARSVIDPIAETTQSFLAQRYATSNLNAKLFVIFWTLSMSDIDVPTSCYEREISRLEKTAYEYGKLDDDPKRRKERERCNSLISKLKQEQEDQLEHTKFVKMYLESEKNSLFCENSSINIDDVYLESRQFVQHCLFARCIFSACDAVYSARFMLFLHELKVENYPTIICLDRLLCDLTYMMGACTENEANHFGRFLCNILRTISNWHSNPQVYNAQCEQFPGSIIDIEKSKYITYETYRDICYKWHYRLTRSFSVALESDNYIQIRNALIVMISIIEYYPAIKHFGKGIGIKIEEVRAKEKTSRQDLYALATAYAGRLDERKPNLIPESTFHNVDVKSNQKDRHSSSKKKARHS